MSKRTKKLQRISRRLTTHQLRRLQEKDVALGFDDLFGMNADKRKTPYFLGYYSDSGIKYALEKYEFYNYLHRLGYNNLITVINTEDPYKQRIAIYDEKKRPDFLISELVAKRRHVTIYPPFPSRLHGRNFEMVSIEWLCLQNPKATFSEKKPRLPGQKYPGLGIGESVMELLVIICGRLRTAGLVNIPEHYHNAQMYSTQFFYIDPVLTGKLKAMARDLLQQYSLAEVTWAVDLKCVTENNNPFEWFTGDQVIPLDRDLQEYFYSRDYIRATKEAFNEYHYTIDPEKWNNAMDLLKSQSVF